MYFKRFLLKIRETAKMVKIELKQFLMTRCYGVAGCVKHSLKYVVRNLCGQVALCFTA